jgi:hypothetical protein
MAGKSSAKGVDRNRLEINSKVKMGNSGAFIRFLWSELSDYFLVEYFTSSIHLPLASGISTDNDGPKYQSTPLIFPVEFERPTLASVVWVVASVVILAP